MWDCFAFLSDEFNKVVSSPHWDEIPKKCHKIYDLNIDLVPIHSCFGGMAFYKKNKLMNCEYSSVKEECEHISLYKCMKQNNVRLFMNPKQIIRYNI
jgi:hypothetical protein